MSVVAYKDGQWMDIKGPRPEIKLMAPSGNDYYFHVPERDIVLRWSNEYRRADEPLGEIYAISGNKIGDIPPYIHPAYKGLKEYYRSCLAWVQETDGCVVSLVAYCPVLQDFRVKLNLTTMKYLDSEFGVR